jgi:hypothetical protein
MTTTESSVTIPSTWRRRAGDRGPIVAGLEKDVVTEDGDAARPLILLGVDEILEAYQCTIIASDFRIRSSSD